jgi:hypothetical protein
VVTDWSEAWRRERNQWTREARDGHVKASFLKRCGHGDRPEDVAPIVPDRDVPLAETYRMNLSRRGSTLRWEINGTLIGEKRLTDDERQLTQRLVICNYGKGTGAVFRNLVIRARLLGVDPSWPAADRARTT